MDIASLQFVALGLAAALLFHLFANPIYRKAVLTGVNLIFIASYITSVEQVLPIGRHRSTPDTSAGRQEKEARRPHADRGAVPIREVAHRKTTEVTCPCSGLVEVPNGRFQQT